MMRPPGHVAHGMPGHQCGRQEIDVESLAPRLEPGVEIDLVDGMSEEDPRVVDQDVDPAQCLGRLFDHA